MNVTHPVPRGTQSRLTGMADAILAEITFSLGRLAGDPDICEVIDLKNVYQLILQEKLMMGREGVIYSVKDIQRLLHSK